ncbi:MAG: plasmid segregation centromere-binding protein ParR [Clostridia bacterium]|nr:plasmid segregation centromere-binding protein ParR [Clostridia bacterium]
MTKRFSLRFNLDNEADRRAWEHLQSAPDSKNKAIITSINAYFETDGNLEKVIRETIRECLKDISVVQAVAEEPTEEISEDENTLMDALDMFM